MEDLNIMIMNRGFMTRMRRINMKIKFVQATGCPAGQFVVEAENEQESAILEMFVNFKDYAKDIWQFWLHGSTSVGYLRKTFNFGWIKKEDKKILEE